MAVGRCDVEGSCILHIPYPSVYTFKTQNLGNFYLYLLSLQGDSGGPFVCKVGETWQLVGVTSWGRAYCTPFPSVYTRITHYRKWLTDNSDGEL